MRITKENLSRYDQHFKSWQRRRLGCANALENWHQTEEAGAVAFYPVGGSMLEGKVKFSFKETPPASGDKSPSNPSTITGVSSIRLLRAGKNLLNPRNQTQTVNGVTFTENADGSVTVNGTNTSTTGSAYYHVISASIGSYWRKIGFTYHLSGCPSGGSSSTYYITAFGGASMTDFGSGATKTMASAGASSIAIAIAPSASVTNLVFWPQLELGSVATAFEKFAGDEYTLPLNDTYYGGEIDLATGLMTVTWYGEYVSTITNTELASNYVRATLAVTYGHMGSGSAPAYFRSNYDDDGTYVYPRYSAGTARISISLPYEMLGLDPSTATVETARTAVESFLAQHPCFVVYRLYTPQTVQLDPLALAALAQTSRHEPRLNTVYTDADSIQITYQKSPIRAATEQEMAILGLGGNV